MAKVLVAFYNGIDSNDINAIPCFYESFIEGLRKAGNDVLVFTQPFFGLAEYDNIDECPDVKRNIIDFNPELCIVFNYAFCDISDIVDCPIVVYEVDSPIYYGNKSVLRRKKDRFIYFVPASDSINKIKGLFGVDESKIFIVSHFTEIRANQEYECDQANISFIGTNFYQEKNWYKDFLSVEPNEELYIYHKAYYEWLRKNPTADINTFWNAIDGTLFSGFKNVFSQSEVMHTLSAEKRLQVLSAIEPLGLRIYGTKNWREQYYCNTALNMAYDPTTIYSRKHNQDVYNSSKIGISVSHVQAQDGFPWRIMDIMASNACIVSDYHSGYEREFPEVVRIMPIYENQGEAYVWCKKLLEDEPLRKDTVERCQSVIDERFRFIHCLKRMEDALGMTLHI